MSGIIHEFHPEEVMAYLDGEVTGERALALVDHLEHCAECSLLADDFCALSQQLIASWKIEPSPLVESPALFGVEASTSEEAVGTFKSDGDSHAAFLPSQGSAPRAGRKTSLLSSFLGFTWRPFIQRPWVWALASACVMAMIVSSLSFKMTRVAPSQSVPANVSDLSKIHNAKRETAPTLGPAPTSGLNVGGARARSNTVTVDAADAADKSVNGLRLKSMQEVAADKLRQLKARQEALKPGNETSERMTALDTSVHSELVTKVSTDDVDTAVVTAQMIERTASLSMTVKEMDAARAALEDIAKRQHGYLAELNTEGQSEAGQTLTASMRVPTDELDAILAELRKLGHLDEEKQAGEEVSQQHIDLEARLRNARNTEKRLTDLLIKRADKLKDVLDVERELASTREEIERMEAQLRNMENKVSYASIDLTLREEYKPTLNLAPPAIGTRLRNALVNGYHSAVESALGLVLFLFQEGPSILLWLLILFFPARWTWRKLRAAVIQKQSLAGAV